MTSLCYSIADQDFATTASTGIFNTSMSLLGALAARPEVGRLHVLANSGNRARVPEPRCSASVHDSAIATKPTRVAWDLAGVYEAARRSGCDWLLLPKGFASFLGPPPVRLAAYVHDILAVFYADRYPGSVSRWQQAYFTRSLLATLARASVILTNTETTKREITAWAVLQRARVPPVAVVGYGFAIPERRVPKRDQVLVFLRQDPHKRADLTLEWVERWRRATGYSGRILCVGSRPGAVALPAGRWSALGRVPAERTVALMAESRAVVHFSEYEGLGMPPVEAILAGTCPVYSDVPATVEILDGRGAGFSNARYESFAAAMERALGCRDEELGGWARELVRVHHWDAVAERAVAALE